jgi:SAM-dependent methyltransferase
VPDPQGRTRRPDQGIEGSDTTDGAGGVAGVGGPAAMYEPFAAAFAAHAEDGAYNAHYDRPAVLELLGDVTGLRVLDAGCGPGLYAEALVEAGAVVTAFDASPTMVELARARVGGRADVRVADLDRPLSWLDDASQDRAVLALVLHHVPDRVAALAEIARVLRPGGRLVVSTSHPTQDWLQDGGSYFDRTWVEDTWQDDWAVRWWRQPLDAWCAEFAEAGLVLERLVELRPAASMADRHPQVHDALEHSPGFVAFRLLRP